MRLGGVGREVSEGSEESGSRWVGGHIDFGGSLDGAGDWRRRGKSCRGPRVDVISYSTTIEGEDEL